MVNYYKECDQLEVFILKESPPPGKTPAKKPVRRPPKRPAEAQVAAILPPADVGPPSVIPLNQVIGAENIPLRSLQFPFRFLLILFLNNLCMVKLKYHNKSTVTQRNNSKKQQVNSKQQSNSFPEPLLIQHDQLRTKPQSDPSHSFQKTEFMDPNAKIYSDLIGPNTRINGFDGTYSCVVGVSLK